MRRCQKTWIPMKFSTNYCRRHFIRVQLQSECLRSYYLKGRLKFWFGIVARSVHGWVTCTSKCWAGEKEVKERGEPRKIIKLMKDYETIYEKKKNIGNLTLSSNLSSSQQSSRPCFQHFSEFFLPSMLYAAMSLSLVFACDIAPGEHIILRFESESMRLLSTSLSRSN